MVYIHCWSIGWVVQKIERFKDAMLNCNSLVT